MHHDSPIKLKLGSPISPKKQALPQKNKKPPFLVPYSICFQLLTSTYQYQHEATPAGVRRKASAAFLLHIPATTQKNQTQQWHLSCERSKDCTPEELFPSQNYRYAHEESQLQALQCHGFSVYTPGASFKYMK